jgi:farnesyl diphosphate synthase
LAGDALLTLAFGLIASPEAHGDPFIRCELIGKLAAAAGYGGMAGGKIMDLSWQGRPPELPEITRLARLKTAALVTFCCEAGAVMGKASASTRQALAAYGQELGLAYQIMEDSWKGREQVQKAKARHRGPPSFRFWVVLGRGRMRKRLRDKPLLTLICLTRRPIFCGRRRNLWSPAAPEFLGPFQRVP